MDVPIFLSYPANKNKLEIPQAKINNQKLNVPLGAIQFKNSCKEGTSIFRKFHQSAFSSK